MTNTVLLMGPGPSHTHPQVMEALSTPTRGIFDPDLLATIRDMNVGLKTLFGTENEMTFTLSASGMIAMEAGFANLTRPGDRVVVCCNGFFGERMANLAERAGCLVTKVQCEWGTTIDLGAVEQALASGPPAKLLAMVYAETSTGFRNNLDGLGDLAHRHGALFMVDAVTAIGGMSVGVDNHGIDYCYAGSQKCIGSAPGLAPVTLSPRAWEALANMDECRSFYVDFRAASAYWVEQKAYHCTPSSVLIFGLHAAVNLALEEGLEARYARHQSVTEALRSRLADIGFGVSLRPEDRLPMLTAARVPAGKDAKAMVVALRMEHGIEVGAALGAMASDHFRIGTMGHSAQPDHVDRIVNALKELV